MVCPACGEENSERARFCQACGTPLEASRPEETRTTVTVVFSDVVGSTELAERLDTESFTRLMNRYFERMRATAERHGGTVAKFIGDAVVAVFGVPTLHEDDALRGVRSAVEMREELGALNAEIAGRWPVTLAIRTGVNTGEILRGGVPSRGSPTPLEGHIAVGDAMNLGARLQQAAEPGQILLSESTYRLVRPMVDAEPVPALALKGKAEPVRAYRLLRVAPESQAVPRRLDAPMVGRRDDLATLRWAQARSVRERTCGVVTILGAAGVGKSRLVREFIAEVGPEATVLRGRCLPYGEGITFWPLAEMVKQAARITEQDTVDQATERIEALLGRSEDADHVAGRIAQVVGLSAEPGIRRETFWSIRTLLESLANDRPLIAVFDDIHWAEPTLLDLIEDVAEWSRGVALLLVCMARPEFLDARPEWIEPKPFKSTTISLSSLAEGEAELLLSNLLEDGQLGARARDSIVQASAGNPLFIEQMLSMLEDEGVIGAGAEEQGPAVDFEEISLPPTIQALLQARLDRLDQEERQVIERAAVIGRVFYPSALAELSSDDQRPTLGSRLLTLVGKQLIEPVRSELAGQDAFRFVHALVRDAAYQRIPKERRGALHEQFAAWLERTAAERVQEHEEILAYHLEHAYRYRAELATVGEPERALAARAAEHLGPAAARALARGDARGAANLLSRATSLLPADDQRQPELLLKLASAHGDLDQQDQRRQTLERAMAVATALRDSRLQAHVRLAQVHQRAFEDPDLRLADIAGEADRAIATFQEHGDDVGLAEAWRLRHWVAHTRQQHAEAERTLTEAHEHAHHAGDPSQIWDLAEMSSAIMYGPTPVGEGIRRCEEILEEVRDSRGSVGFVLGFLGIMHAMDGRSPEGRELIDRGGAIAEDLGFRVVGAATRSYWLGILESLRGDLEAAQRQLRKGYDVLTEMGETYFRSTLAARLAEVLYALDRYEEAERLCDISRDTSGSEDVASQVIWRAAKSKLLARRGKHGEANALIADAVSLAGETDALNLRADVLMDAAEVHRLAHRGAEAAASVREALALYEQKGNVASAGNAQRVLERLVIDEAEARPSSQMDPPSQGIEDAFARRRSRGGEGGSRTLQ